MISPISFRANSKLSIFHINDLHGQTDNIGSILNASKKFDAEDNKNVDRLKLSAGDNICGGDLKKNATIAGLFNCIKLDASAVGNHEFDPTASGFEDFINRTNTDFVSTNLDVPDDKTLDKKIKNSIIKEINGTKYGIVGLTTTELNTCIKDPKMLEGVEVDDNNETTENLQEEIDELKKQGINKIILLSHSGYEVDKNIAKNVSGIDIIVSGHSHDIIEGVREGENLIRSKTGEPVLIIQAGDNGRFYGTSDIEFDENGIILKANNKIYKTENRKNILIQQIEDSILGKSEVVAQVSKTIENPLNRRITPNAWSNLIADSMTHELDAEISLINAANIRKVPTLGKLTARAVTETTPYANELVKTKITEKELVKALKFACNSLSDPSGSPGLLIPSGLRYETSQTGELKKLEFVSKDGKVQEIDIKNPSDKEYSIILDIFLFENQEYKDLNLNREHIKYNFDKDKTAIDYIKKLTNNGEKPLEIIDDQRVKIV